MKKYCTLLAYIVVALVLASNSVLAANLAGKKILFIDSYHSGYAWSDGITSGVKATLENTGVELKIIRMDTKRNKSDDFKKEAALKAKSVIESFKPDVVIAADDNASKFLIEPYFKNASLPFVFCGVNWDASGYDYPYKNVTGMVEVAGAKELVDLLKEYAKGSRVGLLADDTLSSRKDAKNYKDKLGLNLTAAYASDFADWKQKFSEMQTKVDILIVGNTSGINDFDAKAGESHALKHAKIPSGSVQKEPMPYALIGYLKVAEEQGAWSAKAALDILQGKSPSDIPITKNTQGNMVVNMKMAETLHIEIPFSIIESASLVIE